MKIVIALLLSISALSADNYMYFLIDSMNLSKESADSNLSGVAAAEKLYVMMDDNEFEINAQDDQLVHAKAYLTKNRLNFEKDGMRFSTPLEEKNILFALDYLEGNKAEIKLGTEGINILGSSLEAHTKGVSFRVENVDMHCDTGGIFTTDVDVACVKHTLIKPYQKDYGFISLVDLSDKKQFNLSLNTTNLSVNNDLLDVATVNVKGKINAGNFSMGRGSLSCYKDPKLDSLDMDRILTGCLFESKIEGLDFEFKKAGLDARIREIDFALLKSRLEIGASEVRFVTGKDTTIVNNFSLSCNKKVVDISTARDSVIMDGCLEKLRLNIDEMDSDRQKNNNPQEFLDVTNIRRLKFEVTDNEFKLSGKTRVLITLPFYADGFADYDAQKNVITLKVKKTTVMGLPAKKVVLFVLRKVLDSKTVSIKGDTIRIQL